MSNETTISMLELEAESVELLPSRETLSCGARPPHCYTPHCYTPQPPSCGCGGLLEVGVFIKVL